MRIVSMHRLPLGKLFLVFCCAFLTVSVRAQSPSGAIFGMVTDRTGAVLPGGQVRLDPGGTRVVSNNVGQFSIPNVQPGSYTIKVSYLGFSDATSVIQVEAGKTAQYAAKLDPAKNNEQVVVTGGRSYGDAETINEERASDNILNVLPAEVITSLPNANIADAVGRLPGVTLERDEGEGKYVQIRGTEPRLSNLTIDGVEVPSPEGGVRQVKLDAVPADIIDAVQINKTLLPNQPADAIGGSVNLVTRTATDRPYFSLYGAGGFTPIVNTVPVSEFAGIAGKRFGASKRFGAILSGTYDYNGRGIDDIEPLPIVQPGPPAFASIDLREYRYDRTRYGFSGAMDYKLNDSSNFYVKGLLSDFQDFGHRWVYSLSDYSATGSLPGVSTERRTGDFQVGFIVVGGNHVIHSTLVNWEAAVSRSRMLNPYNGGESIAHFDSTLATSNCAYAPASNKSIYRPQFSSDCFTEAYNSDKLILSQSNPISFGKGAAAQLNLEGAASVQQPYHLGKLPGTLEFGARVRNAHKFDDSFQLLYLPNAALPMTQFLNGFKNSNYYDGSYKFGPAPDWEKLTAYFRANPTAFSDGGSTTPPAQGGNSNNFGLVERITAGYVMDTFDVKRFRIIGGVRFEGTQLHTTSVDSNANTFTFKGQGSYVDALPSVQLRFRLDQSSDLRLAYGRRLSRPDPQFLTAATNLDLSTTPSTLTIGNPSLKPEHAHNYDLLYERYLNPLGSIQAGFFYKSLSEPIVNIQSQQVVPGYGPNKINLAQAKNSGSAYITGFELAFQQRFAYLPGPLGGMGLSANYSYTASQAKQVDPLRTDSPDLLRQAPNTFNISPTYDRGPISIRVGMAYNGANIFLYQYKNLSLNTDGSTSPNPQPDDTRGPGGDVYQYSHYQVDAQGSFRILKGLEAIVSGLNLNNEPFGFYQGSKQFMIQREYYKPTFTFGLRWTPAKE